MAKRSLCILLAVLTLFSLAVPAFAAETTSGKCGDNVKWSFSGGTLTISGKGAMYDYEVHYSWSGWPDTDTPWGNSYSAIVIKNGVTSIGDHAFFNFLRCVSVTIPASVTSIGDGAFGECRALKSVTIPESVTSIGEKAFANCCDLKSVTVPESVTSIGSSAFLVDSWLDNNLTSITILNPKCTLAENALSGVKTICGYTGSTAQTYAKENKITFKSLGKAPGSSASSQLAVPTVKIAQSGSSIKVTWNKVTGSAKYMVYYKENGGSWKKIGATAKTSYTRAASKLKNGASYQFAVRCCASDGKTFLSGYKASNKLTYAVKLTVPTVKVSKTSGGIQVTWNKVKTSPLYMVYYRENSGKWKQIGATAKTSYTRAAKNLKNGVTYQFTVRCVASDKKTFLSGYKASGSLKYKK